LQFSDLILLQALAPQAQAVAAPVEHLEAIRQTEFRWFPGSVALIRRGLAVDVAGFLAEDLAAGVSRERLSRRLAGGYSGPVHLDDRAAVRKAWAIRTGEVLDDYHTEHVYWQQAGHGRHEDILAGSPRPAASWAFCTRRGRLSRRTRRVTAPGGRG
jgi:hypothetical protein